MGSAFLGKYFTKNIKVEGFWFLFYQKILGQMNCQNILSEPTG